MSRNLKAQLTALFCVILWGSGMPFTRMIGDQIDAYSLVFIRSFLSAVVMLLIAFLTGGLRKPFKRSHYLWFFVLGLVNFTLYIIFYNIGLQTLESAPASVIVATSPIMTAIALQFIYSEKIKRTGWIAMFTAFIGVVILLMWKGTMNFTTGAFFMFLNACCYAFFNISMRKFQEIGYTAVEINTYSQIAATIQTLIFMPSAVECMMHASVSANLAALYMGILPNAIACYLWSEAIGWTDKTSRVTNFSFFTPLVAAVLGFIIMHEVPTAGTLIGGAVIIASVVVFSTKGLETEEKL